MLVNAVPHFQPETSANTTQSAIHPNKDHLELFFKTDVIIDSLINLGAQ